MKGEQAFKIVPYNVLNFLVFTVMLPCSFLTLLICVLFFILLISLDKGLTIFGVFSKNQFLDLLVLCFVFFVSISFISALVFYYFFLLNCFGFGLMGKVIYWSHLLLNRMTLLSIFFSTIRFFLWNQVPLSVMHYSLIQ